MKKALSILLAASLMTPGWLGAEDQTVEPEPAEKEQAAGENAPAELKDSVDPNALDGSPTMRQAELVNHLTQTGAASGAEGAKDLSSQGYTGADLKVPGESDASAVRADAASRANFTVADVGTGRPAKYGIGADAPPPPPAPTIWQKIPLEKMLKLGFAGAITFGLLAWAFGGPIILGALLGGLATAGVVYMNNKK